MLKFIISTFNCSYSKSETIQRRPKYKVHQIQKSCVPCTNETLPTMLCPSLCWALVSAWPQDHMAWLSVVLPISEASCSTIQPRFNEAGSHMKIPLLYAIFVVSIYILKIANNLLYAIMRVCYTLVWLHQHGDVLCNQVVPLHHQGWDCFCFCQGCSLVLMSKNVDPVAMFAAVYQGAGDGFENLKGRQQFEWGCGLPGACAGITRFRCSWLHCPGSKCAAGLL